jgi:hypothetical protein
MDWKTVESSQIAQVGYDANLQTLGIRFKPTKKQAEEQPSLLYTEYHYACVTGPEYRALIEAKSVGKHFGEHIKPFTDKYPFIRVA